MGAILYPPPCGKHLILWGFPNSYTRERPFLQGFVVMPDFQYIWQPGGHVEDPGRPGFAVEDAVVVGARSVINY